VSKTTAGRSAIGRLSHSPGDLIPVDHTSAQVRANVLLQLAHSIGEHVVVHPAHRGPEKHVGVTTAEPFHQLVEQRQVIVGHRKPDRCRGHHHLRVRSTNKLTVVRTLMSRVEIHTYRKTPIWAIKRSTMCRTHQPLSPDPTRLSIADRGEARNE